MHKEIIENLTFKQKIMLGHQGLPTFFAFFMFFIILLIPIVSFKKKYTKIYPRTSVFNKIEFDSIHINVKDININAYDSFIKNKTEGIKERDDDNTYLSLLLSTYTYSSKNIKKPTDFPTGPFLSIFLLLIPSYFLLSHYKKGKRIYTIIQSGIITKGNFINKENISSSTSSIDVYTITFHYFSDIKNINKHSLKVTTSFTQRFEDEKQELIIFNKHNPNEAFLVDNLTESISKYIKKNWVL